MKNCILYKEVQEYFSDGILEKLEKTPGHYKKTVEKEHEGIQENITRQMKLGSMKTKRNGKDL